MEVDLGGLGLAVVMTGALQEGDRLQGQPLEGAFFDRFMYHLFHGLENIHLSAKGGYMHPRKSFAVPLEHASYFHKRLHTSHVQERFPSS